jgi:signal transduction histidine kinase/ActR/RegA family two-component response regulator
MFRSFRKNLLVYNSVLFVIVISLAISFQERFFVQAESTQSLRYSGLIMKPMLQDISESFRRLPDREARNKFMKFYVDFKLPQKMEEALKAYPEMHSIMFVLPDKSIVERSKAGKYSPFVDADVPISIPQQGWTTYSNGHLFTYFPVHYQEEYYGISVIKFEHASIYDSLGQAKDIFSLLVAGVFLLWLANFIFVDHFLIRPLRSFGRQMVQTTRVAYLKPVEKQHFRELDELAQSFNHLQQRINEHVKTLEDKTEELGNANSKNVDILEALPGILIQVGEEGGLQYINRRGVDFFNAENIANMHISKLLMRFFQLKEVLRFPLEKDTAILENVLLNREGEHRTFDIEYVRLQKSEGYIFRINDTTEKKEREEEILKAQKMDVVGTLAGGLAHDLNNVLSGITGSVSFLLGNQENYLKQNETLYQEIYPFLETMQHSADQASDILKQLLTLSRHHKTRVEPLSLGTTISHVQNLLQPMLDKSISLKVNLPEEEIYTKGDMGQLEQVFLNLCVNAHQAMTIMRPNTEDYGGVLSVEIKEIPWNKQFAQHTDVHSSSFWCVSIIDNGVGINEETLSHIFDPFYSKGKSSKGTGLGLTMVYKIVEDHHGWIAVDSEPKKGSTFSVYLPTLKMKPVDKQASKQEGVHELRQGKGRILSVDDEVVLRVLSKKILERCGYEVDVAEDGQKAVDLFSANPYQYDLVLLDLAMPRMNGRECFLRLRKMRDDIPVLVVSGYRDDSHLTEDILDGVEGFLEKPYNAMQLSHAVGELMDEKRTKK